MPMEPAFDPTTSQILFEVGKELGYKIRKGGTIVTIEGPRFSSKAESNALRMWGGHLVNMTTCPEVHLFSNLKIENENNMCVCAYAYIYTFIIVNIKY